jgi:hypothetical protein
MYLFFKWYIDTKTNALYHRKLKNNWYEFLAISLPLLTVDSVHKHK